MKIVQINVTCGVGSTGKICLAVSELLNERGIENYVLFSEYESDYKNAIKYADTKALKIEALKSRVFGNYGFNSKSITKNLIAHLKRISPDVVHLHNLHGHNCDLKELIKYLAENKIKVFWTFHDCWAFTGYCTHFDMIGCNKWQSACCECQARKEYSWFFDKSEKLFNLKKALLTENELDLTIITPSKWLASLIGQSFLKQYKTIVINNGIDTEIFKETKSKFREKYSLQNKKLILGVAFDWDEKKGIDVFVKLSSALPEEYKIVLVGVSDTLKQSLPQNILSITRTQNQKELAEIYSAADVLFNPTRQENFPTVNLEALSCGTPVVTFNTGGSPETIDSTCGVVVEKDNIKQSIEKLKWVSSQKPFSKEACTLWAKNFNKAEKYKEYLNLYTD